MDLKGQSLKYKPYQVVCRAGEKSNHLYYVESGLLIVCAITGSKVVALGLIEEGEFVGELSFFDDKPRATHVVAMGPSRLTIISRDEVHSALPSWYVEQGKDLTKKLRDLDSIVQDSNLRKFETQEIRQLTIEEQRQILQAVNQKES